MPVTLTQCPDLSTRSGIDKRSLRTRQAKTTRLGWSFRTGEAVESRMGADIAPFAPAKLHWLAD